MASVAGPKSVSCDICKRSFDSTTSLLSHCEEYHNDQYLPLKCNICNCTFTCNDELKEHLKNCEKSEVINKLSSSKEGLSSNEEDGAEKVYKAIDALLHEMNFHKELTDKIPCIKSTVNFTSVQLSNWVNMVTSMEFPLDIATLKSVIYIEGIMERALKSPSAAECTENQKKWLQNIHFVLSDLADRHWKR